MVKRITLYQLNKEMKEGFKRINNRLDNLENQLIGLETGCNKLKQNSVRILSRIGYIEESGTQGFQRPRLKVAVRFPQLDLVSGSYKLMPNYGPTSIGVRE